MPDPIVLTPEEQALIVAQRAKLTDKQFAKLLDDKDKPAPPNIKDIGGALLRTIFESADSKKSMTGLIAAVAAVLSLIAGKQGWAWLDPQTSQWVAGIIVTKGALVVLAHMHVDAKTVAAAGMVDAQFIASQATTQTPPAGSK